MKETPEEVTSAVLNDFARAMREAKQRRESVRPDELSKALDTITDYLAGGWSTGGGRVFGSLFGRSGMVFHLINLYDLSSGLDGKLTDAVIVVFRAAMVDVLTEDQKRRVLQRSGEFCAMGGGARRDAGRGGSALSTAADKHRWASPTGAHGVAFFERGLQVARSVGRIWIGVSAGRPMGYGTGFMISPRLLMTNHHVLGDKAIARTSVVEFDYQVSVTGALLQTTNFSIDPDTFFFADERLDYAIVAVRETAQNGRLSEYGWNPLIEEEGKAIISQWVTARYEAARAALEDFLYEGAPVPKNRSIVSERKASTK